MKISNLVENQEAHDQIVSTMETLAKNTSHFFYNPFAEEVDEDQVAKFNQVKDWKLISILEDSCMYASELVIILSNGNQFATINNYDAGGSAIDNTNVEIVEGKEGLKELFNTRFFAFNGLDSFTDKRVQPRFNFATLIDSMLV
jgi:hypothetical protein